MKETIPMTHPYRVIFINHRHNI